MNRANTIVLLGPNYVMVTFLGLVFSLSCRGKIFLLSENTHGHETNNDVIFHLLYTCIQVPKNCGMAKINRITDLYHNHWSDFNSSDQTIEENKMNKYFLFREQLIT